MKKFGLIISILLLVIAILCISNSAFAATTTVTLDEVTSAASPADFVAKLYQYALGIAGTLAVIMIVYGEILYIISAGNTSKQSEARDIITSSIWGIVLLAGAYLILSTINPEIVNLKNPVVSSPPTSSGGGITPSGTNPPITGGLEDQQARSAIEGAGISVKRQCAAGEIETENPCVSLGGIKETTVDEIIGLNQQCDSQQGGNCDISVTAGTGKGHNESGLYSHKNGYKFDLSYTSGDRLENYIKSNFTPISDSSSGYKRWKSPSGSVYMLEGNHWDVTVIPPK